MNSNPIPFLRRIALLEGVSFILLLGIAMPLKYLAHLPEAVKIAGWVHGMLFILFCIALNRVMANVANWPFSRSIVVFVSALLPFGPFILDNRMKVWAGEAVLDARDETPAQGPT